MADIDSLIMPVYDVSLYEAVNVDNSLHRLLLFAFRHMH